jgi:hypothetical protein
MGVYGGKGGALKRQLASPHWQSPCGELVSIRIAKVGDEGSIRALCGRTLDRSTPMRGTSLVPREDVIAARGDDADGPTVGRGRRIAVDRLRDHQPTALVGIDQPPSLIQLAGLAAKRGERRIVEGPCPLQVVAANHDVREHASLQKQASRGTRSRA